MFLYILPSLNLCPSPATSGKQFQRIHFVNTLNYNSAAHLPPGKDWAQTHKQAIKNYLLIKDPYPKLSQYKTVYLLNTVGF